MNFFRKFKRTFFWKIILLFIIKPIYDFIWVYIINVQAKLTLISWNSKNKEYFNLNNNNQLLVRDNEKILDIAKELNRICTKDFLDKSRDEMKSNGVNSQELFDRLEYNIKEKIINFASSDLIVNTAARYMGIFPVLSRIYFYHNIPNLNGESEIRSQKWHKDGMGYKGLDFFISITDINLNNGPFFFLKKNNSLGAFSRIENVISNPIKGERNKISNEEFEKVYQKTDVDNIVGPKGTCVIVDSYNCYHKGGYLKSGDRVMLRIAFDTIDSMVLNFDEERYRSNDIFYYNKKHINDVDDKFLKFLYFKRSTLMKLFKVPQKLLKFYQIFHFKIT